MASLGLLIMILKAVTVLADDLEADQSIRESPGMDLAIAAVRRYAATDLEQWRYLRTTRRNGSIKIDMHDPGLPGPEHWQLISIEGREPTESEFVDYSEDRSDHSGDASERMEGDYVANMIVPGSWMKVDNATERPYFEFDMKSPDGRSKKMYRSLRGSMWLTHGKGEQYADRVRINNTLPFYPWFGVRMSEASLDFRFTLRQGVVLPDSVEIHFRGRAFMVHSINEDIMVTLSQYQKVRPATHP